ncbi:MAG: hypothetical protein HW412_2411, partial [Bacteroidetes bacterium]|nr:hypothetical protein [Bacteroidota bacterium]
MKTLSCILLGVVLGFSQGFAQAQIPRVLSYQGVLSDSLGRPKPDGQYVMTFRLYDVSRGGVALWIETKALQLSRGLFSTMLGDQNPFGPALRFDRLYWLSAQVSEETELS